MIGGSQRTAGGRDRAQYWLNLSHNGSAPRFRMTDDALNLRKLAAKPAFKGIDRVVHGADRQRRIDMTMKIDDFARGSFPNPHVMNLAEDGEIGRQRH